ncbi:Hypothetical_protein [Hexamita inflata]|uniref:Hypothetical_protein n=1 Tax=Hexamita inflata TaxID=28002 RepID=A0AA86NKN0_9EUKA|nr:Hypothetical protein HINF_LOCUS8728 [Hexamita inflata]
MSANQNLPQDEPQNQPQPQQVNQELIDIKLAIEQQKKRGDALKQQLLQQSDIQQLIKQHTIQLETKDQIISQYQAEISKFKQLIINAEQTKQQMTSKQTQTLFQEFKLFTEADKKQAVLKYVENGAQSYLTERDKIYKQHGILLPNVEAVERFKQEYIKRIQEEEKKKEKQQASSKESQNKEQSKMINNGKLNQNQEKQHQIITQSQQTATQQQAATVLLPETGNQVIQPAQLLTNTNQVDEIVTNE